MKIFHLFLILNIVVCVGGLCNAPAAFAASNDEAIEGCHSMDQHKTPVTEVFNIERDFNQKVDFNSSCCSEYLTNNSSDQHAKVNYTSLPRGTIQSIITEQEVKINHLSQREHDPPDLQVLNSIFLI